MEKLALWHTLPHHMDDLLCKMTSGEKEVAMDTYEIYVQYSTEHPPENGLCF